MRFQLLSTSRRRRAVLPILVFTLAAALLPQAPAIADPTWAPAGSATIKPGVMVFTAGGQCTANFIFYDDSDIYIGQAAHCSSTGGATSTNGCDTGSLPVGTPVEVNGASMPGTMAYNSWLTMQEEGETDPNACLYNDLALVRLDPADHDKVNPSIPHWGGPTGINTTGAPLFQKMFSYGNSSLRFGIAMLSPKIGISQGDRGAGWSHTALNITPGIPGDSGSAFLDKSGRALGVLSTVEVGFPGVITNGIGDISRELDYMRDNVPALSDVELALGTETFNPRKLPLGPIPILGIPS